MILNFYPGLMWFLWLGPFAIAIAMLVYVYAKKD